MVINNNHETNHNIIGNNKIFCLKFLNTLSNILDVLDVYIMNCTFVFCLKSLFLCVFFFLFLINFMCRKKKENNN